MNHLWQSTAFAAAVALLTLAFRRNRAGVRYLLWWSASVKFLLPFTLLAIAATRVDTAPAAKLLPSAAASTVLYEITEPFSPAPRPDRPAANFLFLLWAAGAVTIAALRVRGYLRVRSALRSSVVLPLDAPFEVRSTTARLEPGIAGFRRPILLLPTGIAERLTTSQLDSILTHELCHARRRDNLTAAAHMLVETLFWFHPLVWWIGARLVEERERACDEAVVAAGGEPREYADAIVNVCRLYVESPVACVSGVTGADLKKRLHAILTGDAVRDLGASQKLTLALLAIAALAVPFLAGALRAQPPAAAAKFDVASIRPCRPSDDDSGRKSERKGGGGSPSTSPGTLITGCETVESLIRSAYVLYATGRLHRDAANPPLEGGPAWIRSEHYRITAKAESAPGQGAMHGPLMRALLEDRFKVKIRRESREVPVYALIIAKSGPRLTPNQAGSCTPVEVGAAVGTSIQNPCRVLIRQRGPNLALEGKGATLDEVARLLYLIVDRPVVDRTDLQGRFDFDVEFAPEQAPAAFRLPGLPADPTPKEEPTAPRIFVAFEKQLGVKLEPAKGPREYLVIDQVEHPTKN